MEVEHTNNKQGVNEHFPCLKQQPIFSRHLLKTSSFKKSSSFNDFFFSFYLVRVGAQSEAGQASAVMASGGCRVGDATDRWLP